MLKATSIKLGQETYDKITRLATSYYNAKPSEIIREALEFLIDNELRHLEGETDVAHKTYPSVLRHKFAQRQFFYKGEWKSVLEMKNLMEEISL